jgi:hypothetical protein
MPSKIRRKHIFDAKAQVLSGHLELPLKQEIRPQAFVSLPPEGGYLSERAEDYRLEGIISFHSAYTQVAGNLELKPDHGWSTLTTSVIEGLNVLDVVTADRVVAQISTEHPLAGYVPSVTFLGTRFENLKIAGHPVRLEFDANILGTKPSGDGSYCSDSAFSQRVAGQHKRIQEQQNLPAEIFERYNRLPSNDKQESVECSLVNHVEGSFPGRSFGHVIDVPHFGQIYLATLRLEEFDFVPGTRTPKSTVISLSMIVLKMGCLATGTITLGSNITNGKTKP